MENNIFELIKAGDHDAISALLAKDNTLVHQPNGDGAFPIHFAVLLERREIVQLLIQHGADINTRDEAYGATPTAWVVEYLRELGGLIGSEIDDLAWAIETRNGALAARLIERFPALRSARNAEGALLAELALESGDREVMNAFLERS